MKKETLEDVVVVVGEEDEDEEMPTLIDYLDMMR